MASNDHVKVTRPDGTEVTVSRKAWDGVYQYRDGWKLVEEKKASTAKSKKSDS